MFLINNSLLLLIPTNVLSRHLGLDCNNSFILHILLLLDSINLFPTLLYLHLIRFDLISKLLELIFQCLYLCLILLYHALILLTVLSL